MCFVSPGLHLVLTVHSTLLKILHPIFFHYVHNPYYFFSALLPNAIIGTIFVRLNIDFSPNNARTDSAAFWFRKNIFWWMFSSSAITGKELLNIYREKPSRISETCPELSIFDDIHGCLCNSLAMPRWTPFQLFHAEHACAFEKFFSKLGLLSSGRNKTFATLQLFTALVKYQVWSRKYWSLRA